MHVAAPLEHELVTAGIIPYTLPHWSSSCSPELTGRLWRWPTSDQRCVMPYFTLLRWCVYISLTPLNRLHMAWNSLISWNPFCRGLSYALAEDCSGCFQAAINRTETGENVWRGEWVALCGTGTSQGFNRHVVGQRWALWMLEDEVCCMKTEKLVWSIEEMICRLWSVV